MAEVCRRHGIATSLLFRLAALPATLELAKFSASLPRSAIAAASLALSLNSVHTGSLREQSLQRRSRSPCKEAGKMVAVRLLMPGMIIPPRSTPGSLGR